MSLHATHIVQLTACATKIIKCLKLSASDVTHWKVNSQLSVSIIGGSYAIVRCEDRRFPALNTVNLFCPTEDCDHQLAWYCGMIFARRLLLSLRSLHYSLCCSWYWCYIAVADAVFPTAHAMFAFASSPVAKYLLASKWHSSMNANTPGTEENNPTFCDVTISGAPIV